MHFTDQHRRFFDTFGYVVLRDAIAGDVDEITSEFEAVFTDSKIEHDGSKSTSTYPFLDRREGLCSVIDHPALDAIATGLLGPDYVYIGSDGNFYSGDTRWHRDSLIAAGRMIKVALYLDPVTADTGALRVIPGSHKGFLDVDNVFLDPEEAWGLEARDVPAVALETKPGDLAVFDFNTFHASFGGGSRRRMMSIVLGAAPATEAASAVLDHWLVYHNRFLGASEFPSPVMIETAPPARMRHLRDVIAREERIRSLPGDEFEKLVEPARTAIVGDM